MKIKFLNKKTWMSFAILITGIALTIVATVYTKKNQDTALKNEFRLVCNDINTIITTRLHAHALLLRSGAAYFAATDNISRKEWKIFIENTKFDKNLPGIQGVGFAVIVKKERLLQHIQQIRTEGFAHYTVRPAGDRAVYTSIIYLEPFADRNLRAFGYDMYSEPIRRKAMDLACDNDIAALSEKVILVQETGKDLQAGTLMYVPVYRKGMPTNTVNERRAAIYGWVYSPYRMVDLMKGILGRWGLNNSSKIHLRMYDNDSVSQKSILFDSQQIDKITADNKSDLTLTIPIVFKENKWILHFSQSTGQFPYLQNKVLLVLISGLIISFLLAYLCQTLMNTRIRAQQIAEQLTVELHESEARFSAFMDNLPLSTFIKDNYGRNIYLNRYLVDLMGFKNWENKLSSDLIEKNESDRVSEYDKKTFERGESKYEEILKDCVGNYRTFETYKFVIPREEHEPFLGGISLDITDRKLAEQALIKSENTKSAILRAIPDMLFVFNQNGDYLNVITEDPSKLLFSKDELIGRNIGDLFPHDIAVQAIAAFKQSILNNELVEFSYSIEINTVTEFFEARVVPSSDDKVLAIVRNITDRKLSELALKEERQRLSGIIKGTNVATWEWNIQTGETIFNERWAEIIGYTLEEISPVSFDTWVKFSHPDDFKTSNELLEKHFRGELDYYDFESRMKHKNGNWVWVMDKGKVTSWTDDGKPLMMMGSHLEITERKLAEEELKESREQLRRFTAHLQQVREKERLAITLEIHDSLAQYLVALKMDMGMFMKKIASGNEPIKVNEVITAVDKFILQVDNTSKSARMIMNGLRPEQLELLGFIEATEVHLQDFEATHHIPCEFSNELLNQSIPPEQSLALFRILQESLINICKHAMATLVKVRLTSQTDKLVMEIIDNGVGFDKNNCGRPDSFGLIGMNELIKMQNGSFSITTKHDKGTTVKVELPYKVEKT